MKTLKILVSGVTFALACLLTANIAKAQQTTVDSALLDRVATLEQEVADQKPGESHLLIVGLTTFGYVGTNTTFTPPIGASQSIKTNSLGDAADYELSPMFLWRHDTKFLIEFEPSFTGNLNSNTLGVNWANISYFAAPGLVIHGGYFVLPFGIYNKRLAAGWIDKVAPDPNGIDLPGSDFGVGVSGGYPIGDMKWSFDVSLTNGLQLQPDGELQGEGIVDNHNNKTISGRLGLLPLSNSSLEIGVSALHGGVADAGTNYNNANVTMYGFDLSFVKNFNPLLVNVKGQWSKMMVNSQNYVNPVDSTSTYTFTNNSTQAFAQISVRPIGLSNGFLKNLELAYRYVSYNTPNQSTWGANYSESDFGLDYWLSWRTVLKLTYGKSNSVSTSNASAGGVAGVTGVSNIWLQFSIQL